MLLWPLLSREISELCVIKIALSAVSKTKQRVERSAERGQRLLGQLRRRYLLTTVIAKGNIILRLGRKKATLQEAAPREGRPLFPPCTPFSRSPVPSTGCLSYNLLRPHPTKFAVLSSRFGCIARRVQPVLILHQVTAHIRQE